MRTLIIFCSLIGLLYSCKENQDITEFDLNSRYLHFSITDSSNNNTVINYAIQKTYSFAEEEKPLNSKRIGIPLALIGQKADKDLTYAIELDEKNSTLPKDVYEFEPFTFRKEQFTDSVFIKVKRTAAMKNDTYQLAFEIKDNENFKAGHMKAKRFNLFVTDQLTEPSWWFRYTNYMGPFYPEVYQQWIYIYPKGADPTLNPATNKPRWYWGEMPTYTINIPADYPVLYYHILKLKKYFQDNVVYPNGDSSKPRILLP